MRKHYIVTYGFKGKYFSDHCASFAASFDAVNGDELAMQILEEAEAHALANTKNPIVPNTSVAIIKLIELADENEQTNKGETNVSS